MSFTDSNTTAPTWNTSISSPLRHFTGCEFAGVLFIEDESLDASTIADITNEILEAVDDPDGRVFYVSRNWL